MALNTKSTHYYWKKISDIVTFIHKKINILSESTLLKETDNGQIINFPMMTTYDVSKTLQKSEEIVLGHLDQKRKTHNQQIK